MRRLILGDLFGHTLRFSTFRFFTVRFFTLLLFSFLLPGCSEPEPTEKAEIVRSIKYMTLKPKVINQARLIAGVISPTVSTKVAFEISGQILKLNVAVGDRVKKGDVLAEIDPQTYSLKVQSAEGNLKSALARLADAEKKFEQQRKLYQKKFTTKTEFDSSLATLESARSEVSIQDSALKIAKRDLAKTSLLAPFDGAISEKSVEVFEEVTAGKEIVTLHTEDNYEVDVSLPETLVNEVKIGNEVDVKLSIGLSAPIKGYVKEISSQAGQANAFPVTIGLSERIDKLRPGMSAEVTFKFQEDLGVPTFAVPTTAVLPSGEPEKAYVFIFNKEKKFVERREVRVVNIRDNDLLIAGQVKNGDVIATAGVSFLYDKRPVRLLQ